MKVSTNKNKTCKSTVLLILTLFSAVCLLGFFASCKNDDEDDSPKDIKVAVTFLSGEGYWLEGENKVTQKVVNITSGSTCRDEKPAAPEREHYTLSGWYRKTGEDIDGTAYRFEEEITAPLTLIAKWKNVESSHVLTFDSLGGSEVEKQTVEYGACPKKPINPTKDKKSFVGWYMDKECNVPFIFSMPLTTDTTVYARWADFYGTLEEFNTYVTKNKSSFTSKDGVTCEAYFSDSSATTLSFNDDVKTAFANTKNNFTLDMSGMTKLSGSIERDMIGCVDNNGKYTEDIYKNTSIVKVFIPNGITTIGEYAFCGCQKLKYVQLPSTSLTTIAKDAFCGCSGLEDSSIVWPKSGRFSIEQGAFGACNGLKKFIIPGLVSYIANGVFGSCKNLISIEFKEGVESIGSFSFQFCEKLKNITLPKSLKELYYYSFADIVDYDEVSKSNIKIQYNGTMEEFGTIKRTSRGTYPYIGEWKVICSDGEITKSDLMTRMWEH